MQRGEGQKVRYLPQSRRITHSFAGPSREKPWISLTIGVQARKKSTKIYFLGPEIAGWGGGLPRERVVVEKFVLALESLSSLGFEQMSLEFCRDIPDPWGCSKSLCKKSSCAFSFPRGGGSKSMCSFSSPYLGQSLPSSSVPCYLANPWPYVFFTCFVVPRFLWIRKV